MSYSEQDSSIEGSAPIELYKITGVDSFYYTSLATEFTFDGDVYKPIPISRTAPTINEKETSGSFTVNFPFNNPFVQRYLGGIAPAQDRLEIFRAHLSDSTLEVKAFLSGFITGVKFKGTDVTVSVGGIASRMEAQIPSKTFSWMCNHVLYGKGCKVAESRFTFNFEVLSVSSDGIRITVKDTGQALAEVTADTGFFNGGTVRTGVEGSQRMALEFEAAAVANTYVIKLMVPVDGLEIGQGVSLSAGCDRALQTCSSRFSNSPNYGGFPFIPTLNPFSIDNKNRSANR
jgi:uncharacterized phage protein (TIGR02218 family)